GNRNYSDTRKNQKHYFHAETLTLILDNYCIHKSRQVSDWLARHPKFNLLFLPVYSLRLNKIERLWQSLHETVTRNHGCQYMWQLLEKVKTFLNSSPYMNSRE
ncbi:transposase, partial [Photorhabdus sp. APURE]|uniref:transposase n=1 Tax=Photorhabdus aballayi TaxID=2991723 RepID=UPI00223E69A8